MGKAIPLREDYNASDLRTLAKASDSADQTRRLLALAEIYDGRSRGDAARVGGVGRQTVRDWVLAFNAKGPEGLLTAKSPGASSILDETMRHALAEVVKQGPTPEIHGVVRWRQIDLIKWLFERFGVSLSKQTISRELRAMGFRKISARPRHHAQNPKDLEDFKKKSPRVWKRSNRPRRRENP